MDRSHKRLFDKVSVFFQRRWWRREPKPSELVPETTSTTIPSQAQFLPKDLPDSILIQKQDSAVSVSSATKLTNAHASIEKPLVNTPSQLVITVSSVLNDSTAEQQPSPLLSESIHPAVSFKRQSQHLKSTFRRSRASVQSEQQDSDKVTEILLGVGSIKLKNKSTVGRARTMLRSRRVGNKKKQQPESTKTASEVAAKLNECSFRNISVSEIKELQRNLQDDDGHWEESFLQAGGYEALNFMLWEIASSTKRQCSDEFLREIADCYKLLLAHNSGAKAVFSNLQPIYLVRDLLFGTTGRDKLTNFNVGTRLSLLGVLNQLQLVGGQSGDETAGAGYELLYQLLCDVPIENNDGASSKANKPEPNFLNRSLPIRKFASSCDFRGSANSPKFSSWMRELARIVDQSIKPASFLTGVLDYRFDNKQSSLDGGVEAAPLDMLPHQSSDSSSTTQSNSSSLPLPSDVNGEKMLISLVDNTAIIYLNSHLKLMQKIIEAPPINQSSPYGLLERESVRREFLKSGFSNIAASLLACPYAELRNSYIHLLTPLLHAPSF